MRINFQLDLRKAREGKEFVAGLVQTVGHRVAFQAPFADKRLALCPLAGELMESAPLYDMCRRETAFPVAGVNLDGSVLNSETMFQVMRYFR